MHSWAAVTQLLALLSSLFAFVSLMYAAALTVVDGAIWTSDDPLSLVGSRFGGISAAAEGWTIAVVPWVVPLVVTLLVTILVWLAIPTDVTLLPFWADGNDEAQLDDESGAKGVVEVRIAMGTAALVITAAYVAWALWALVWVVAFVATQSSSDGGQGTLVAILVIAPIAVLLGLSAGRFARSRSAPLLDLVRARDQSVAVRNRIARLRKRTVFTVPGSAAHGGAEPRRRLWVATLVVCTALDAVLCVFVVWSSADWNTAALTPALFWQAPLVAAVIVVCGSLFASLSVLQLLRTVGIEGRIQAALGFLTQALFTGLLLVFSALYSTQTFGPIPGVLLAIAFVIPVISWVTPWWRDRQMSPASRPGWKFVLAGNAYDSLQSQLTAIDTRRRALEATAWDRYRKDESRGWRRILGRKRANPWTST